MPEAPDLVVIREFLLTRLVSDTFSKVIERKSLALRNMTSVDFESNLAGRRVESLDRQGKLLIISPMLTGALMWCEPSVRMMASIVFVFDMEPGKQLRYIDQKKMGQVYYLSPEQRSEIVRLENQEPDVIDEHLSFDQFVEGLRPFRGEVKGCVDPRKACFWGRQRLRRRDTARCDVVPVQEGHSILRRRKTFATPGGLLGARICS